MTDWEVHRKIAEDLKALVADHNIKIVLPVTQPPPLRKRRCLPSKIYGMEADMIIVDDMDLLR
jgi:hypothetical protein